MNCTPEVAALISNVFSNINFLDGFQSYGDLFEIVVVDLSIPIDSSFQKLQNCIVSKLRKH